MHYQVRRGLCLGAALLVTLGLASSVALAQQTAGLFQNDPGAYPGYTLMSPNRSFTTFLINNDGQKVHEWQATLPPGTMGYMLEDGSLMRSASLPDVHPNFIAGPGRGGRVEQYSWDGQLIWEFEISDDQNLLHHDIEVMPNGNVLMLVWQFRTAAESIQAGRNPAEFDGFGLWPERIIEVQPTPPSGGNIVWEWNAWDHLVQEFDASKDNFGVVADHPELIDINFTVNGIDQDFLHSNGLDYNPDLDQIVMSVHRFEEFWIIDHSTTTAEAAGSTGGDQGKGGDLLYRWGNPQTYGAGTAADQKLFRQHDAQWIPPGFPGAGNILLYNNGWARPAGEYSTIEEIVTPVQLDGSYPLTAGSAYDPPDALWTYTAPNPTDFYSRIVSGTERMPNGNTLICAGTSGNYFEVDPGGNVVWQFINPIIDTGPIAQGTPTAGLNNTFKIRRYPLDFPAFTGRDLSPKGLLETIDDPPAAVPDGRSGTQPLLASRTDVAGNDIAVSWDNASCAGNVGAFHLIYGELGQIGALTTTGAECDIDLDGSYDWSSVPAGDLYFLVVAAEDAFGIYEGSWGQDSAGNERLASAGARSCGVLSRAESPTCP